jgi:glycosyltransferase involved in cell wall biosynthesis
MPKIRPLLTIGMPVFNEQRFLERAISSILNQKLANFKLLIADNASIDGSWEIIESFAKKDPRIECFRQSTNIGAFRNFIYLLSRCDTEFFAWSGSHDFVHEDCYQVLVDRLKGDPEASLVYGSTKIVDGMGAPLNIGDCGTLEYLDSNPIERACKVISTLVWCHPFYGVYRTAILRKCRLLIPSIGPDHVLLMEVGLRGRIIFAQEALYYRREYRTEGYDGSQFLRAQLERVLGHAPSESMIDSAYFEWWYQHLMSAWRVEGHVGERIKRVRAISRTFTGRWLPMTGTRSQRFTYLLKRLVV